MVKLRLSVGMGGIKIKTISLILVLVIGLILTFPLNALAEGINTGPYLWSLDSRNDIKSRSLPSQVSFMERNHGPGDNGQTGRIVLEAGKSHIWISDQTAEGNIALSSGAWVLQLVTDADWGTKGNKCQIEIGEWDGSYYSHTAFPQTVKSDFNSSIVYKILFQTQSLTIRKGNYLALKVTNLEESRRHIIYTGEKNNCSFLRSPETYTMQPIPELNSGMLLIIGLAGLTAFVLVRGRSFRKR